ncbi:hypothetical protein HDIA_2241 [Hartmannibacter diazotrophicus]|uniref:Sulfate transporter n=1 Tax=Hartmannibacter diazotrophicus TaxID=1482074 RepID=A0A2C9D622_9HYPH|nr:DUF3164 family protein [Hartmannibacter diazotrophicus]SON55782.1 hypothetical protein HDIA_2241 [Hartmannibacter diazotrophicus]
MTVEAPEKPSETAVETGLPPGAIEVAGKPYMQDAKGALVPLGTIKAQDLLIDETVRKIIGFARDLNAQIRRFGEHTSADIVTLQETLDLHYGAKAGGAKGNVTLTTFDGRMKVTLKIADQLEFGPELQAAKKLVDECLMEWSADSNDELRSIVTRAFQVDQEGKINRAEIFMLLRAEISDPRWLRAMQAVRDSIRVVGSKSYLNFHVRENADGKWMHLPIDLANA